MIYSAGDIVEASYTDFNGAEASSVFVVVYNEALDSATKHNRNLTVLKITTQLQWYDTYSFTLDHEYYGLPYKSIVKASKVNTIEVSKIFRYIGALTDTDWNAVKNRFERYEREVQRQSKIKI